MPLRGAGYRRNYNLDDPNARLVSFLRYYRQVYGAGTMDLDLVTTMG